MPATSRAPRNPPTLLLLSPHEWHLYARRPHWEAIARRTTVVAVEPPVGLLLCWRHPRRLRGFLQHGWRVRRGSEKLYFMRPLSLFTYGVCSRLPGLGAIDRWLIGRQVRRAVRTFREKGRALVQFTVKTEQSYLADVAGADLNCYEVTDEYRVLTGHEVLDPDHPFTRRAIRREDRILQSTDLVIASSEELRRTRAEQVTNTHYLPNCADYDHFATAASPELKIPADMASCASPRLGFIGNLTNLIDVGLLNRIAEAFPGGSLVLVGREEGTRALRESEAYRELKARPNACFLGFKDYGTLPGYLKGCDVCLMPYRTNAWMQASSPNKTYQYLAAGKPIVSVDFPEIRRVSDCVYVAAGRDRFITMITTALAEKDPGLVVRRQAIAREHTVDSRAERVLALVAATLADRR